MSIHAAPTFRDFGGQKLAIQLSSSYAPQKHLESNSFIGMTHPDQVWLGIMNSLEMYDMNYTPLISMNEMTRNTVYVSGNQTSFLYGQPFKLGCPFIKEVLCENNRLGYGKTTFHIVISENAYTYHDVLMTNRRHGRGMRVVPVDEGGEDAKIIPFNGGWRFLIAMASGLENDYVDISELRVGTEVERVDATGGDEFKDESTSYNGGLNGKSKDRHGMDLYQYNIGVSEISMSYLITADASLRHIELGKQAMPQLTGLPVQASTDIINFFSKDQYVGNGSGGAKLSGVTSWIPRFIANMARELKDLQETKLMYSQGWSRSNGRETLYSNMGIYPSVKLKGNHFYYSDANQAFDLIKNMLTALYSGKYNIPIKDRKIEIELGDGIFEWIQPMFKQYFESDNKIIFTGEHPAYRDVLRKGADGGMIYEPVVFEEVFYPNFGRIKIKRNSALSMMDNYKKNQVFIGRYPESAYMIVIKDITDKNFTGANLPNLKKPDQAGNILFIKKEGVTDSIEFTAGSGTIAPALLSAVGANPSGVFSRDNSFKGLKILMRTHGEVFVQDASRMVIAEYDPTGEKEFKDRATIKAPLFK